MNGLFPPQGLIGWTRLVAVAEGISYLLFAITMPLKYGLGMPEPNWVVGAAHGGLFITYGILTLASCITYRWRFWTSLAVLGASLLPFATFIADKRVFAPQQAREQVEAGS